MTWTYVINDVVTAMKRVLDVVWARKTIDGWQVFYPRSRRKQRRRPKKLNRAQRRKLRREAEWRLVQIDELAREMKQAVE